MDYLLPESVEYERKNHRNGRHAVKGFAIYFAISIPLKLDLFCHGPISAFLSAATGLPIE